MVTFARLTAVRMVLSEARGVTASRRDLSPFGLFVERTFGFQGIRRSMSRTFEGNHSDRAPPVTCAIACRVKNIFPYSPLPLWCYEWDARDTLLAASISAM